MTLRKSMHSFEDEGYVSKVMDFMEKHRLPMNNYPYIYDESKLLRIRLLVEETAEAVEAIAEGNALKTADALADLLYVTFGAAIAFGIPIKEVFDEVHASNMSKSSLNIHSKAGKSEGYFEPDIEAMFNGRRPRRPGDGNNP